MSVNSKMTAIADEIRELSGTTGAMGLDAMASTLNTENTNFISNLSAQDSLIAQIQTALQNKAAGSGGGSSGGGSVETCTVTIILTAGSINCAMANVLVDGIITPYGSGRGNGTLTTLTIENVVCNSLVLIQYSNIRIIRYSCSGDLTQLPNASGSGIIGFKAPSEAGASASCTIWDNF